jgi:NADP-dependent 3-hydroxy acid dehydrogenase YdfG
MQTALVTGATSGVGQAIARALAGAGYRVLAVGRDSAGFTPFAGMAGIEPVRADITDREALRAAITDVPIDVLVNNAGIMPPVVPFDELPLAEIDRAIATNLTAAIALTSFVVPGMRERRRGHIFFTGSTAGHASFPRLAVYCATKAGLGAFADSLRLDLAPHRIRVTEIVAGRTETNLYKSLLSAEARAAMYANDSAVKPEQIAEMVLTALALPPNASLARFDIIPTWQATPTGAASR